MSASGRRLEEEHDRGHELHSRRRGSKRRGEAARIRRHVLHVHRLVERESEVGEEEGCAHRHREEAEERLGLGRSSSRVRLGEDRRQREEEAEVRLGASAQTAADGRTSNASASARLLLTRARLPTSMRSW